MSFFTYDPNQPGMTLYKLQDTFVFGCDMCGECCNALERTVPLSGPDVARIAGYLNLSKGTFLDRYTVALIDPADNIPNVVLRPEAGGGRCVLQRAGRCLVHPVKPRVCALYPISRAVVIERAGHGAQCASVKYTADANGFLCGNARQSFTVEQWLHESGVPVEDTADVEWSVLLAGLSDKDRHGMDGKAMYHQLFESSRW